MTDFTIEFSESVSVSKTCASDTLAVGTTIFPICHFRCEVADQWYCMGCGESEVTLKPVGLIGGKHLTLNQVFERLLADGWRLGG